MDRREDERLRRAWRCGQEPPRRLGAGQTPGRQLRPPGQVHELELARERIHHMELLLSPVYLLRRQSAHRKHHRVQRGLRGLGLPATRRWGTAVAAAARRCNLCRHLWVRRAPRSTGTPGNSTIPWSGRRPSRYRSRRTTRERTASACRCGAGLSTQAIPPGTRSTGTTTTVLSSEARWPTYR
jgi:hypothetical protein